MHSGVSPQRRPDHGSRSTDRTAADSRSWAETDFSGFGGINAPTLLDGTSVTVGGQEAFIDYISPTQVNVQIPSGVGVGGQPVIVSTTASGASSSYDLIIVAEQPGLLAPSLFSLGGRQDVAALFGDGTTCVLPLGAVSGLSSRPASAGDIITV